MLLIIDIWMEKSGGKNVPHDSSVGRITWHKPVEKNTEEMIESGLVRLEIE